MSSRLQDIEAFLAGDRRQAELALAYNGINLKEHFPSLSSEERVEAVRIARHLLAEWSGSEGASEAAAPPETRVRRDKPERSVEQSTDEFRKIKRSQPATADSGLHAEPDEHIAPITASDRNNRWMLLVALLILAAGIAAIFGQRLLDFGSTFQLLDVTDESGQVAETETSTTQAPESGLATSPPPSGETAGEDSGSAEETELRNRVAEMLKAEQEEADRLAAQSQDTGPESGAQTSALPPPESAPQPEPESATDEAPAQETAEDALAQNTPQSGTDESDASVTEGAASAQPEAEALSDDRVTSETVAPTQSGQQVSQPTARDEEPSNTLSALIRAAGEDGGPREDESAQTWLIRRVQISLVELGYNPGPIDGIMGPRTQAGIEDFQRAEGLPVDGEMNARLLDTLTQRIANQP